MARKINRTCITCGEQYFFCGDCSETRHLEPWHSIYHDGNCKKIFMAVTDYLANEITKSQAKEILNTCDLSKRQSFKGKIPETINEIFDVPNSTVEIATTKTKNDAPKLMRKKSQTSNIE